MAEHYRCDATRTLSPASTMLGKVLGEALDNGDTTTVRCRLDAGHAGPHRGSVCPFPGFADQNVTWDDRP